jgi:putative flippase GtrA
MRIATFLAVGALGFAVQMSALAGLLAAGCPALIATAAAAAISVVHNFFWHEHWTWADRPRARAAVCARLAGFVGSTGVTSIAGGVAFTAAYVRWFQIDALTANVLAVGTLGVLNFLIADRWIFSAADGFHRNASSFERSTKLCRQMVRSGRVAVNANRLGLERHE